jgi:hypothetical protein
VREGILPTERNAIILIIHCIGWTREGDDKHTGCAVLLSNGEEGNKTME